MDVINGNLAILDERLKAITESEASANLKAIAKDVEDVAITMSGEMQQAIINTSQAFTGDFVNALMDGKDALQSFKDFAKSLVAQIIQIFLQMAVVNNILNSVFNLTGANALPTINSIGGGSTSSIPTSGAGSFAADIANPNYFGARLAGGGAYQKGMPMLVGERGAELMIPNTSGTVANSQQTRSMLGGSNPIVVNQNLNFSLGVVPTVRAEIQKQLPTIANTAKVAVLEGVQRGGSYRKGIHGV
jgi:phage-related minor tail protein